jgi:hypothetical protein
MAEFEGGMVASVRFEGEYIFVFQSQFMSNSRSTFEIQYALNTVLHLSRRPHHFLQKTPHDLDLYLSMSSWARS